ncbi:hypothetical protein AtNW77_Chr1g0040061 [Arabidopsis thaliana]
MKLDKARSGNFLKLFGFCFVRLGFLFKNKSFNSFSSYPIWYSPTNLVSSVLGSDYLSLSSSISSHVYLHKYPA